MKFDLSLVLSTAYNEMKVIDRVRDKTIKTLMSFIFSTNFHIIDIFYNL